MDVNATIFAMAVEAPERPAEPASPARGSGGRRLIRLVGVLMVAIGLGFVGYFAWQYWGTNIVAKQKHAEIREAIAEDWGKGIDSNAIGLFRLPRFGEEFEVPIMPGGDLIGEKGRKALAEGVAWYELGAGPGEIGNFVVAGHRVTHGEPFRDFPKLREGDKVYVETRSKVFTYVLRNDGKDIEVPFTTSWPLADVPDPQRAGEKATEPVITLVTCAELFRTKMRNVVIGDLESTEDKATGTVTKAE